MLPFLGEKKKIPQILGIKRPRCLEVSHPGASLGGRVETAAAGPLENTLQHLACGMYQIHDIAIQNTLNVDEFCWVLQLSKCKEYLGSMFPVSCQYWKVLFECLLKSTWFWSREQLADLLEGLGSIPSTRVVAYNHLCLSNPRGSSTLFR